MDTCSVLSQDSLWVEDEAVDRSLHDLDTDEEAPSLDLGDSVEMEIKKLLPEEGLHNSPTVVSTPLPSDGREPLQVQERNIFGQHKDPTSSNISNMLSRPIRRDILRAKSSSLYYYDSRASPVPSCESPISEISSTGSMSSISNHSSKESVVGCNVGWKFKLNPYKITISWKLRQCPKFRWPGSRNSTNSSISESSVISESVQVSSDDRGESLEYDNEVGAEEEDINTLSADRGTVAWDPFSPVIAGGHPVNTRVKVGGNPFITEIISGGNPFSPKVSNGANPFTSSATSCNPFGHSDTRDQFDDETLANEISMFEEEKEEVQRKSWFGSLLSVANTWLNSKHNVRTFFHIG